jgi:hypothetical protein
MSSEFAMSTQTTTIFCTVSDLPIGSKDSIRYRGRNVGFPGGCSNGSHSKAK